MKNIIKKVSDILIILIIVLLSSQVMAKPEIPDSVNIESNSMNIVSMIIYLLQLGTFIIAILFFIINLIKIVISKMTMNHKFKYFILAFLIMILGFSSVGIIELAKPLISGLNSEAYNYVAIVIGIIVIIISIILNVILFIRINKRDKINRRIADENNSKKD